MNGQLSLELLIVILSSIVMLSIFLPQIQKAKQVSDYALSIRNAQLIVDKLFYSCERVQITGVSETVTIFSISEFSIKSRSGSLSVSFGNKTVSRPGFGCTIGYNLSRGSNRLTLAPDA